MPAPSLLDRRVTQERFEPQLEALALAADKVEAITQRVAGIAAEKCQTTAQGILDGLESRTGQAVICFFREARANAETQNFRGIMTAMIRRVSMARWRWCRKTEAPETPRWIFGRWRQISPGVMTGML